MRSKKQGWSVLVILVALLAAIVVWTERALWRVTPRTELSLSLQSARPISLPVSPLTVLPAMKAPTDAGPIYRRAITEYKKIPFSYGQFARSGRDPSQLEEELTAVNILLEATNCASADLFASWPQAIVNLNSEKPDLEALQTLATCARRGGQLIEKAHPAQAIKLYEAVFSLGAKLYQERLTYAELDAGLRMMAESATLIGLLDSSRADTINEFNDARKKYVAEQLLPIERAISTADQATLQKHAGDVFYFATSAGDRMWRVEAIFSLARYRFNAGNAGDQRQANRIIHEILRTERDAAIVSAAQAASDLTIEEYRMLK